MSAQHDRRQTIKAIGEAGADALRDHDEMLAGPYHARALALPAIRDAIAAMRNQRHRDPYTLDSRCRLSYEMASTLLALYDEVS